MFFPLCEWDRAFETGICIWCKENKGIGNKFDLDNEES